MPARGPALLGPVPPSRTARAKKQKKRKKAGELYFLLGRPQRDEAAERGDMAKMMVALSAGVAMDERDEVWNMNGDNEKLTTSLLTI